MFSSELWHILITAKIIQDKNAYFYVALSQNVIQAFKSTAYINLPWCKPDHMSVAGTWPWSH